MSCSIKKNGQIIFRSSVSIFESLYHEIKELLTAENLKTNSEFDIFIEKLDETTFTLGGTSIDIAEIFNNSKNLELLINLLEKSIIKLKPQIRDFVLKDLLDFYFELKKYKEELETEGH